MLVCFVEVWAWKAVLFFIGINGIIFTCVPWKYVTFTICSLVILCLWQFRCNMNAFRRVHSPINKVTSYGLYGQQWVPYVGLVIFLSTQCPWWLQIWKLEDVFHSSSFSLLPWFLKVSELKFCSNSHIPFIHTQNVI
jgi:hypothetical protein